MADLKHRDWLLYSQIALIQKIDPSIPVRIVPFGDNQRRLVISNLSNDQLERLRFFTNTDQNNNYLYIEQFNIYIDGFQNPKNIAGLNKIMIEMFRYSDATAFLLGEKTHNPFNADKFTNEKGDVSSIDAFVNNFLRKIPKAIAKASGYLYRYEVVLNPDRPLDNVINNYDGTVTRQDKIDPEKIKAAAAIASAVLKM